MKPSVPWLLISSAITLPLSSIVAAEPLVMASLSKAQSQEQNGNRTLSSTDNYDGTSQTDTPFTRKESSTEGGTTYTLESDVSFTNISKTQLPSASETQKESKDVKPTDASSENKSTSSDQTSEKSSSDHSTPNAESPNQESTAETAQPSPTEPSTPTANAVSDENTPKTETTAEPTDQGATDTAQATEEPNKNTNAETPLVSSHRIRANTEPAGDTSSSSPDQAGTTNQADTTGQEASQNISESQDTLSNPQGQDSQVQASQSQSSGDQNSSTAQETDKSCFSNTAGPLTFTG